MLIENKGCLDHRHVLHCVEAFLPFLNVECLVHDSRHLNLSRVYTHSQYYVLLFHDHSVAIQRAGWALNKIVNSSRELVDPTGRTNDVNLLLEDFFGDKWQRASSGYTPYATSFPPSCTKLIESSKTSALPVAPTTISKPYRFLLCMFSRVAFAASLAQGSSTYSSAPSSGRQVIAQGPFQVHPAHQ